jgi:tetratricopeptide (TPR) repeat protein
MNTVKRRIIGMTIRKLSSAFLFFCFTSCFSQSVFHSEYAFLEHLESISDFEEGIRWIEHLESTNYTSDQLDSLMFIKGVFQYREKQLEGSLESFGRITRSNLNFWNAAKFYSGIEYAYLNKYEQARNCLMLTDSLTNLALEIRKIELAGLALIERNESLFQPILQQFDHSIYAVKENQEALIWVNTQINEHKRKSPLIAGLMSSIVPGSGKMYTGLYGQGTMTLMANAIFGLQAYEGLRKDGIQSVRFVVFTSLFSVFYVANIWGSVVTVRLQEQTFNDSMNETILVNMHIPLRLIYK